MTEQDVIDWFEDVAKRNKKIAHTDADKRFARNVDELEYAISTTIPCKDFTLVLAEPLGKIIDTDQNSFFDLKTASFMILKLCTENDWTAENEIYVEAKAILFSIISKILNERKARFTDGSETIMQYFQTDSLNYRKEIILDHNLIGVNVSFKFLVPCDSNLTYDESEWS